MLLLRVSSRAARFGVRGLAASTHFSASHEYVRVEGSVGTVGITDFAQSQLGDVVFVSLPEVGATYKKGDSFAAVESVKAASDVYAPVSGTVTEVNKVLGDDPGLVNKGAESSAWFVKMKLSAPAELPALLDSAAYAAVVAAAKH